MKSVPVALVVRCLLFVGIMVFAANVGFATDPAPANNGELSRYLSNQLFCNTTELFEGDIGLLIGLILVFAGLWSIVQGAKIAAAMPFFIIGALITAIPSLILSMFTGLGTLLKETGITTATFAPPTCPALTPEQAAIDKAMKDNKGSYYPSRGVYEKKFKDSDFCKKKPEDARCS